MNPGDNSILGSKRLRPDSAGGANEETDPAVMLRLYLSGVAAQHSVPLYGYKKKGCQFACVLSLFLEGKKIELCGMGLSKAEAKQAASADALRCVLCRHRHVHLYIHM